ncbi:MAG: hypothetical protein ACRD2F_11670, partial [Terriglobales bacterium]
DMSFFGDFSSPVTLSCAGLAAPAACSFSTNPVQPPAAGITLTVTGLAGLPSGTVENFTVIGSGGGLQRSQASSFTVSDFVIAPDLPAAPPLLGQATPAFAEVRLNPAVANTDLAASFQLTGCAPAAPLTCAVTDSAGTYYQIHISGFNQWQGPDQATVALTAAATEFGVTVTHTLNWTLPIADFSLSATTPSASVKPGGIAAYPIMAKAINGWYADVLVSCSGLPIGASCTLAPEPDVVAEDALLIANPANPFTLDIQTAAAKSSLAPPPAGGGAPWLLILAAFAAAAAAAALWPHRRQRLRWIPAGASILLLAAFLAGCGGGPRSTGGGGGGGGGANLPPATTYQVTVTATETGSPAGWTPVTHTLQLSLTVQ